jgi:hypothetical protein
LGIFCAFGHLCAQELRKAAGSDCGLRAHSGRDKTYISRSHG